MDEVLFSLINCKNINNLINKCIDNNAYKIFNDFLKYNTQIYDYYISLYWNEKKKIIDFIYRLIEFGFDKEKYNSIILDAIIEDCIKNNYYEKFYRLLEISLRYDYINYDLHLHIATKFNRSDMSRELIKIERIIYSIETDNFCPISNCLNNDMNSIIPLLICKGHKDFNYSVLNNSKLKYLLDLGYLTEDKIKKIKDNNKKKINCIFLDNIMDF